jgi:hypothetical protein
VTAATPPRDPEAELLHREFAGYMKARGCNPDLTMVCSNFGPGDLRNAFTAGWEAMRDLAGATLAAEVRAGHVRIETGTPRDPAGVTGQAGRILPEYSTVGERELSEAIHQALGFASVCWEPMDCTGVFEEARVRQVADELTGIIGQYADGFLAEITGQLRNALGTDPDAEREPGETAEAFALRLVAYCKERIDELHRDIANGKGDDDE